MNNLEQVKYNNDLILTTDQLAEFYGTTARRISENFKRNIDKFVEGKHYYAVSGSLLKQFKDQYAKSVLVNEHASSLYLWTKRGASRHSKMLGTDQAWNMYDELEENYFNPKQNELDVSNLSPELQMFKGIFDSVARQEQATKKLETKIDNGFKGITEIVGLNVTDWRKQTQALIHKMAKTQGGFSAYQEIGSDIYAETDRRAGSDLHRRLINLRKNMAIEGASKSKQQRANKLDVIENDKRLKEIYLAVVKDFAIKYQVWNSEY